jgi:hypothetical protein
MKKVIIVSVFILSPHGYSEVQETGDKEMFVSLESLDNADRGFQEEFLKKEELKLAENKDSLMEDSLERYGGLHKGVKPCDFTTPDGFIPRDSAGRTADENKYAYRPNKKS